MSVQPVNATANVEPTPDQANQEAFDAALEQAMSQAGTTLIGQLMMQQSNEILNEAMSDE
ncbi:hypothetical protein ATN84_20355 [Paramesorhizobium deserti]|uniref:Uncharacterized protein n=1 Tax=Paramesorhizobium deserti TaxID=1494590 RepID=A0A135HPL2_9HYPH|nr:hypothetical protein [Paramesorhizobium deserti]KXF75043.1 hypothetical protein ATN84_20355 [Paramesorhizobium deserti]